MHHDRRRRAIGNNADKLLQLEQLQHREDICCSSCRTLFLYMLQGYEEMQMKLDDLLRVDRRPRANNVVEEPIFDTLQMLPINDRHSLLEFDQHSADPVHRQMRSQFAMNRKLVHMMETITRS